MAQSRRIFGGILILVGVAGVALAVAGIVLGRQAVDSLGASADTSLTTLGSSLDTVQESLLLAKATAQDASASLTAVSDTAVTVSDSLQDTRPLLREINTVVTDEAPTSLETLSATIPDLVQVAGAIDDTLTTLDSFRVDTDILGFPLNFDLGVTYQPEQPFDETVALLGRSVETLPGQLRGLAYDIRVTSDNLDTISQDVATLADDLDVINGRIAELDPMLDDYLRLTTELSDQTRLVRANLAGQMQTMKIVIVIVCLWLALSQLATLYLGWELVMGRRCEAAIG